MRGSLVICFFIPFLWVTEGAVTKRFKKGPLFETTTNPKTTTFHWDKSSTSQNQEETTTGWITTASNPYWTTSGASFSKKIITPGLKFDLVQREIT